MLITQQRFSHTISFEFEPETLTYTRSDAYGSHSFQLPYGSIGMDPRQTTERNGTLFNGGILLSAWGLAQTGYALAHGDLLGVIFLIPGLACLLFHALAKIELTSLSSDAGEIALLHDKNYERIMDAIRDRRKKQLLDWYGNINFANDPEEEIRKFHWLHSQHLISEGQLEQIVTTIRNADPEGPDAVDEPFPPRQ
ncbi:MAG: hypothetical protein Q7J24_08845 [Desulfomicrobium sp.]|nr:hypothetical protein [Desulfomicrobium sp.]MDP3431129.1 hypothetical protein [Desulfomicrobium sp.]